MVSDGAAHGAIEPEVEEFRVDHPPVGSGVELPGRVGTALEPTGAVLQLETV